MEREPYDIACLASMLIHFLTTVGVSQEEGIDVLRTAEDMLVQTRKLQPVRQERCPEQAETAFQA